MDVKKAAPFTDTASRIHDWMPYFVTSLFYSTEKYDTSTGTVYPVKLSDI